jgi:hypothetical protein
MAMENGAPRVDARACTHIELVRLALRINAYAREKRISNPRDLPTGWYRQYCVVEAEMRHRGEQLRLTLY